MQPDHYVGDRHMEQMSLRSGSQDQLLSGWLHALPQGYKGGCGGKWALKSGAGINKPATRHYCVFGMGFEVLNVTLEPSLHSDYSNQC